MPVNTFFDTRTEQSSAKIQIVGKFFATWANVLLNAERNKGRSLKDIKLGYVDLYSGPGRYRDNTPSTPLTILEHIIGTPDLVETMICQFNDANPDFTQALRTEISQLPGSDRLKYEPRLSSLSVESCPITTLTALGRSYPTLYFLDPWGYKGITLELLGEAIGPYGCDCIFFFNFKRINAAITNLLFKDHVDALFGEERAEKLRREIVRCRLHSERQRLIIDTLDDALKSVRGKYNLEFLFSDDNGDPSHFLILTSKVRKAYDIMKNIMASASTGLHNEIPSFHFDPLDKHKKNVATLFELDYSVTDLKAEILRDFAGESITFENLYIRHSIGRKCVERNYRTALIELESEKKVEIFPPARERWRGGKLTCGKDVVISFFAITKQ